MSTTLAEAKEWLRKRVNQGACCPCCGQHAQVYRWTLYRGAVRLLVRMYSSGGTRCFVESKIYKVKGQGGDCTRLALWGLVEQEKERRPDGGKSGWWRVTPLGEEFILGRAVIPKHVWVYDGRRLKASAESRTIHDVLGVDFNYNENVHWSEW